MHDLVVRDLEQARNRTLGLTDAQLTAHMFDFGRSGLASSSVTWQARPGRPAEPAADRRTANHRHPLERHPQHPAHRRRRRERALLRRPGLADVPHHQLVDVADGVVTVTELEA